MCGGESDRERTGEEVMIYSWRTWLGLSRAAVREERWRWRPGLDQEATGARQCDSLASVRPATTYFLPPTSHHFFHAPPQPAQSPRPSHASGRPTPRHPATDPPIVHPRPAVLASMHARHAPRRPQHAITSRARAVCGPMTARRMGSHLITATLNARDGSSACGQSKISIPPLLSLAGLQRDSIRCDPAMG